MRSHNHLFSEYTRFDWGNLYATDDSMVWDELEYYEEYPEWDDIEDMEVTEWEK